jgi:hypothetical protein
LPFGDHGTALFWEVAQETAVVRALDINNILERSREVMGCVYELMLLVNLARLDQNDSLIETHKFVLTHVAFCVSILPHHLGRWLQTARL